jgi:hypothetical protein
MKKITWLAFVFLLSSCATIGSESLTDVKQPLADIQGIVLNTLPLGKRDQSINGREFYSEYFIMKKGDYLDASAAPQRNTLHVLILGDRRPYRIDARVISEERNSTGSYSFIEYNDELSMYFIKKIESALNKRRDNRNIIDDFRAF